MNKRIFWAFAVALSMVGCSEDGVDASNSDVSTLPSVDDVVSTTGTRDPLLQPFSPESIWNMPIGLDAEYVHAYLIQPTNGMIKKDEDHIVLTPTENLVSVEYSDGKFQVDEDTGSFGTAILERCVASTTTQWVMASLPIPKDFIVTPADRQGGSYNNGLAVLMQDKRYIYQGQPYAHCTEDGAYTLGWNYNADPDVTNGYADIYGTGIYGAHGGSGLSAIGGTLRVHELTPTSGPLKHALKINIYGAQNLTLDASDKGYRWPARMQDSYAATDGDSRKYGSSRGTSPVIEDAKMGALFALKPDFDVEALRTEPAKVIAQALIDYGAYVVDDTAWSVFQMEVEYGPAGDFTEEFEKNWGFPFEDNSATGSDTSGWSDWALDIRDMFVELHIIADNAIDNVGGAGERRVEMAAALKKVE